MNWDLHAKHFNHYLKLERSLSSNSIQAYLHDVALLQQFMSMHHPNASPLAVTTKQCQQFLQYINELGMSAYSQARILSGVKGFYKYLMFEDLIDKDPTELIEGPKIGRKLPDTLSYPEALKYVVRQDPDIVLLGEMRDLDTMSAALTAAQTGHLVLSTIHTIDAMQTINRIIDIFPANQQSQIRTQLSLVLEGIVCQALLPKLGGGRVCSLEIMVPTPAIRNLIREDKVHQIYSAMQTGQEKMGMQTTNQSLASLHMKKAISLETALNASSNKEELQEMINRGVGIVAGAGLGRTGAPPRPAIGR